MQNVWDDSKPLVSVCIVAYMHEHYIAQAIESVLMQKTNFDFEIIIGDDFSSDGTRDIITRYAEKNSDKIHLFFPDKNLYHTKCKLSKRLRSLAMGKYYITLEGDDFWIDECKLQKQADFLESNPEFIAVAHKCRVVGHDSQPLDEEYPSCMEGEYTKEHWFSELLPGQTTTVMRVNPKYHPEIDLSIIEKGLIPGDRLLFYTYLFSGRIACMDDVMSAYRHVTTFGTSFSAQYKFDIEQTKRWNSEIVEFTYKHGDKNDILNAEVYYFRNVIIRGIKKRLLPINSLWNYSYCSSGKAKIYIKYIVSFMRKRILHKKVFQK